jgi:hypothetical protein
VAIDPSIALQTQPFRNEYNPLAASAGAAQTVNALVGAQAAQRQLAAQQAIGQAVQQATDPNTGYVDQNKVRALVSSNPDAAFDAQQAVGTSQAQQGQQLGNQSQAAINQHQKIGFLAGLAAPLAADPSTTKAKVQDTIQHAVNFGLIDQPTAQQVLNSLPDDSAGVRQNLGNFLKSTMAPGEEYGATYGTNTSINNGPNIVSGVTGPADQGGGFRPGSATPLGVSPETAAGQVSGVGPDGRPYATTAGARLQGEGAGNLLNPGPTRPVVPGAEKYPWNQGGGYSAAPTNTSASSGQESAPPAGGLAPSVPPAQMQPAPGSAPLPSGAVPVGPAPGSVQAQASAQTSGAEGANDLMQSASGVKTRQGVLSNMLSDLQSFDSGSSLAASGRRLAGGINAILGTSIDAEGVQSAQSFDKFANQIAQQQAATLGAGSDAKLASAMAANPNSHLQNSTNQQMIHTLLGNEDAINAKANAWQSYVQNGGKPGDFQAWNQKFNQGFDPRAFQLLRMTPQERAQVQAQMQKSGQLGSFRDSVNAMANAGLLPVPQQSNNGN